jgi:hypothetical protein
MTNGSIISEIRGKHDSTFNVELSRLIVSGWLSKKSRGRHMLSQIMSSTKRRWFELRCDDSSGDGSYCLLYYAKKGDGKPKGAVRLSAFDSILQSECDLSEITLRLERDKETSHQMLVMIAGKLRCECEPRW